MAAKRRPQVSQDDYAITSRSARRRIEAPDLPYQPPRPKRRVPGIALIGCGGIAASHLKAYRKAGYPVRALVDIEPARAERLRKKFYPQADVYNDPRFALERQDIGVVDLATHPRERVALIEDAIAARKHILSQKPFVEDLSIGKKLVAKARRHRVRIAVNQNGRWAPHVSYARQAIKAGILGEVTSVDLSVHWDHNWTAGTPFNRIRHLALYDFGIHWFDMIHCYLGGRRYQSVFAAVRKSPSQAAKPPLLAHAVVQYPRAEASLVLRGDTRYGAQDRTIIVGSQGTLVSQGKDLNHQQVTLHLPNGRAKPKLTTRWFVDGFDGTMSELLCAIEEDREPYNSAADNLQSLKLCLAALRSADEKGVRTLF